MRKEIVFAMISIFLIVSMPMGSYAFLDDFDLNKDREDLGEIVLVNVDKYEPTTISSDYIRNKHFPVYVHLSGTTAEGMLFGSQDSSGLETVFGDLKVKDFRIIRQSLSRYVYDVQEVPPRYGYNVNPDGTMDLGYLKLYLKRMPVEEQIPDVIDINLTARFEFDRESSFGVYGKHDLFFDNDNKNRDIWDGRANLEFVGLNKAGKLEFRLLDRSGHQIDKFSLTKGNSHTSSLHDGPLFLGNKVRFQVKDVYGSGRIAIMDIAGLVGDSELIEGMNLFPGSDWIIYDIGDDEVILKDEETLESIELNTGSVSDNVIVNCDEISLVNFDNNYINDLNNFSVDNKINTIIVREYKNKFYCSAIKEYQKALENSVGEEENKIYYNLGRTYEKIHDLENALKAYMNVDENSKVYFSKNVGDEIIQVNSLYESGIKGYIFVDNKRVILKEIKSFDKDNSVDLKISGKVEKYNLGDTIIDNCTYDNKKCEWKISDIKYNYIKIKRVGTDVDEETIGVGETELIQYKDDPEIKTMSIMVEKIDSPVRTVVRVLPGDGRNYGESHFTLHLPVEKSLIQWTPEQIDNMINSTHSKIQKLDKIIDKLGGFIRTMKVACFSVFTILSIKNAFFENNLGRREVVKEYYEKCYDEVREERYNKIDNCMDEYGPKIDVAAESRSNAIGQADKLMKNFDSNNPNPQIARQLRVSHDDLKLLTKYGEATGYDAEKIQELVKLSYYNNTNLKLQIDSDFFVFSNLDDVKTIDRNSNLDDSQKIIQIDSLFNPSDYGKTSDINSIGEESVGTTLGDNGYTTTNLVNTQRIVDGKVWDGKNWVYVIPVEIGGEQISAKGYPLYQVEGNKNKLYYDMTAQGSYVSDTYYDTENAENINYYDKNNRLWIFAHKFREGLFENADKANYVVVDYNDEGTRSYSVLNVGTNGRIDIGKDDLGDDHTIITSEMLDNRIISGRNEALQYNFIRVKQDIDREYDKRNRERFVENGYKTPNGYLQSDLMKKTAFRVSDSCYNHMSFGDCKILYNFCDPVMCPPSRFDLGGRWDIDNVIGSGIIGSLVLGWGNNVTLPICLSGVHAGLDNIRSKFQGFEDCLQKAKSSGESVGICNVIRSLYMCEILWREALSIFGSIGKLSDVVAQKIFGIGGNDGGEYMNFKQSWSYLQDSMSFFTSSYASSAFASYNARNAGEFGSQVCKAAIYGKQPGGGDFIGQLLEPTSPYQYTGWFDELPYASADEGVSVYRIYYHIYAGRDEDVYYRVYLKGPGLRNLMVTNPERILSTGYLKRGDYKDGSYTVTGQNGYNQMCVMINNYEKCGFGKVSSEFSLNYLNDMMVEDEANRQINSIEDCSPDNPRLTPSMGSLTTPAEHGLVETGIVRVCSSYDLDGDDSRWQYVGVCGKDEMGVDHGSCYMDTNTVSLNDLSKRNSVMAEIDSRDLDNITRITIEKGNVSLLDYMDKENDRLINNENIGELIDHAKKYGNQLDSFENTIHSGRVHKQIGRIFEKIGDLLFEKLPEAEQAMGEGRLTDISGDIIDMNYVPDYLKIQIDLSQSIDPKTKWENRVWGGWLYSIKEKDFDSGLNLIFNKSKEYYLVPESNFKQLKITCNGEDEEYIPKDEFSNMNYNQFKSKVLIFCSSEVITENKEECELELITGKSNFIGNEIIVHKDFVSGIERINDYAEQNNVKIFVTSSFRKENDDSGNTVVTPDEKSNHLVGHAIDMNVKYGNNYYNNCNSTCLASSPLPQGVAGFIQNVKGDSNLRWGGDFTEKDVVHIDDHYNVDLQKWNELYISIINSDCYKNLNLISSKINICEELSEDQCMDYELCFLKEDRFIFDAWAKDDCKSCLELEKCSQLKNIDDCGKESCKSINKLNCIWDYSGNGKCREWSESEAIMPSGNNKVSQNVQYSDCSKYVKEIEKYSIEYGVNPILMMAMMMQESSCDPNACSEDNNCMGLMQITKGAYESDCTNISNSYEEIKNLNNYKQNIKCGIKHFKTKYNEYKKGVNKSWSYINVLEFKSIVDKCINSYPKYGFYVENEAALRAYNGWGCGRGADVDYVENVNTKKEIALEIIKNESEEWTEHNISVSNLVNNIIFVEEKHRDFGDTIVDSWIGGIFGNSVKRSYGPAQVQPQTLSDSIKSIREENLSNQNYPLNHEFESFTAENSQYMDFDQLSDGEKKQYIKDNPELSAGLVFFGKLINSLNRHPERKNNTHKLFAVLTYRGSGDIIFAQNELTGGNLSEWGDHMLNNLVVKLKEDDYYNDLLNQSEVKKLIENSYHELNILRG